MTDQRTAMTEFCPNRLAETNQFSLGRRRPRLRQWILPPLLAVALAGCSDSDGFQSPPSAGQVDYLRGFIGGAAADEPRAALVARDILSAGGSAADAAAAAGLTYAVTYPNGGGLGGGGFCVVGDGRRAEVIEFPAIAARAGGPVAIPGLVRGLGLLQGRYGKIRWESVVTPAEQLARFGDGASRAFLRAAQQAQPPVAGDPALQPVLGGRAGMPQEGERRTQPKLAAVLARLRGAGPADFYQGALAQSLIADIAAAGGKVTAEELRGYAAGISKPIEVPFDDNVTLYTSTNAAGGAIAAWLIEQTYDGGGLIGSAKLRPEKFAANLGQAYRGLNDAPLQGYGSSSVATIDRNGLSVACAFSMGVPFGARLVGRETGILFAAPPGGPGDETPYLTALVGLKPRVGQGVFAAAASGGATAAAATAQGVLQAALGKNNYDAVPALAQPRLFQAGPQAPLLHEPGVDQSVLAGIRGRGVTVTQTGAIGRVNLAYCSDGVPRSPQTCSFAADGRGFGFATGRQF